MFDSHPQKPLIAIARTEEVSDSFEARVLRELAAVGERLAKVEDGLAKLTRDDESAVDVDAGYERYAVSAAEWRKLTMYGVGSAAQVALDAERYSSGASSGGQEQGAAGLDAASDALREEFAAQMTIRMQGETPERASRLERAKAAIAAVAKAD